MLPENTIESASMNVSTTLLQSSDMIFILFFTAGATLAQLWATGDFKLAKKLSKKGSVG